MQQLVDTWQRLRRRFMPPGSLSSSVMILMAGTALGQAIPLLISPVLTRLYSPEEFGLFALFMSLTAVLAAMATGRYELAVLLPKDDADGANVLAATLGVAALASLAMLAVLWGFNEPVARLVGNGEIAGWLYWVPAAVFLMSAFQALSYWLNRNRNYMQIATSDIALKGSSEGGRLIAGTLNAPVNGLILGGLAGQGLATLYIAWQVRVRTCLRRDWLDFSKMRQALRSYRKFPLFTMPYSLVATFSGEFIIFLLASFGYLQAAGLFGLTRRIVIAPIGLLSSSLGRVFFKEAVASLGTPSLQRLTEKLFRRITLAFVPVFVLAAVWAPPAFAIVFGDGWREAGYYASALMPVAFLYLYTSWPERMYEVAQKQNVSLAIQSVADGVRIFAMLTLLLAGGSALMCVVLYAFLSVFYHVAYLIGIYRVGAFDMSGLVRVASLIAIVAVPTAVVLVAVRMAFGETPLGFVSSAALLLPYYSYLGYITLKKQAD